MYWSPLLRPVRPTTVDKRAENEECFSGLDFRSYSLLHFRNSLMAPEVRFRNELQQALNKVSQLAARRAMGADGTQDVRLLLHSRPSRRLPESG